jgi:protein TonB
MPTLQPVSSAEAAPHVMTAPPPVQAKTAPAAPLIRAPQGPSIETSVDTSPARPTPPSVPVTPPAPRPTASPAPTAQKKPQTNTIAQTARKAAGQGGKAAKGKNGAEENASANAAKTATLARKWGSRIHARISQRAPKGAGKGKAVIAVTVARAGQVLSVSLSRSSGNATLDRLAVRAVKQAGRMPAAPNGFDAPRHTFHIPIRAR